MNNRWQNRNRTGQIRRKIKMAILLLFLFSLLGSWLLRETAIGIDTSGVSQSSSPAAPIAAQSPPTSTQKQKKDTCVECHRELGDEPEAPVTLMQNDIHHQRGLSCADCHGGDPTEEDPELSMDPRRGFVGAPKPQDVAAFCGKCHSNAEFMKRFNPSLRVDQQTEYLTSVHGRKVMEGDQKVATCVSCHDHHGIRAVNDPNAPVYPTNVAQTCAGCHSNAEHMQPYPISRDQLEKYNASVHADALLKKHDLSAPTCNDCHGNHGAAPPGTASVANVCGTCHTRQADLFRQSPHKSAYEDMGLAECLVCHGNHEILHPTDEMLGVGDQATCMTCHSEGEPGYATAQKMREMIDQLTHRLGEAEAVVSQAARAGMEVSRAQFELNDAHDGLINARVIIHGFSSEELEKAINPALEVASAAYQDGQKALDELQFRRKGLAASLVVILLAVVALYFKIRQIEEPEKQ